MNANAKQKILALLKNTNGYISGEEISSHLGITRAAVWKHIRALREEGYAVDSVPNKGYRLESIPDLVTPEEILDGLQTKQMGRSVYFTESTDSTNEEAKRHALMGVPDGSLFITEEQTMGKGRLGRVWTSPKGGGLMVQYFMPFPSFSLADFQYDTYYRLSRLPRHTFGNRL